MTHFTPEETSALEVIFDTVVPEDEAAGGWAGGVGRLLLEQGDSFMRWCVPHLRQAITDLDAAAGRAFVSLDPSRRRTVFEVALAAESAARGIGQVDLMTVTGTKERDALGPLAAVILVAYEGYYGGTTEPAGWAVAGYVPVSPETTLVDPPVERGIQVRDVADHYDVVIIGAGAGGGVAAHEFATAGQRVLLLERSHPRANRQLRGNHLQDLRLSRYDALAGAGAGHPRVVEFPDSTEMMVPGQSNAEEYGLVAMTLGGGTRLWQGMSWRFYPEDFRMASAYGVPEASTLADWPFSYDELAPYYDRVEWELGVSGDARGPLSARTPRVQDLPMPALPGGSTRVTLSAAAHVLGWQTTPIPFAINSAPRDGRPACVQCSQCVGHACPVDAKNGTHNTFVPRAIATGDCALLMGAQALRIDHDGRGKASGVTFVVDVPSGPVHLSVRTDRVVVAAGALETPRLLLASGLGNSWVGRNHHSHGVAAAFATTLPGVDPDPLGPGHSIASLDFVHDGHAWGGGVLFDAPLGYPLAKAMSVAARSRHSFGAEHKALMREPSRSLGALSMVQEIPHESSAIMLDPYVKDRFGMPVVRTRPRAHWASQEAADYMAARASEWVAAAGGRDIGKMAYPGGHRGSQHSAGTARLGADPSMSACDAQGVLWGTTNVHVADASLHTTNGGFNPGLTVMANAMRVARLAIQDSR